MLLRERVAVVTGGGRGIGFHAAMALAEQGARVLIVDKGTDVSGSSLRDSSIAERAAGQVVACGGEALFSDSDVTDMQAMDEAIARMGPVDILVNAAGIIRDRMLWNVPEDEWDDVHRVHLKGCFGTTRALARMLRNSPRPPASVSIVNFASSAGVFGMAGSSAYGAAKSGVVGFTRTAAMELANLNVRANCVVPFAWTRMAGELPVTSQKAAERVQRLQQLRPEDVANLVVALAASDDDRLSGQVIGIRGKEIMLFSQPHVDLRVVLPSTSTHDICRVLDTCVAPSVAPLVPSTRIFDYEPF